MSDNMTLGELVNFVENAMGAPITSRKVMDMPIVLELPEGRYELAAMVYEGEIILTEKEN